MAFMGDSWRPEKQPIIQRSESQVPIHCVIHSQVLLTQPACRALGWALLHFLWQGALAAMVMAACNFGLRDGPARIRYAVGCIFLILLLALPVLTFTASLLHAVPVPPVHLPAHPPVLMPIAVMPVPAIAAADLQRTFTPLLPWIVALWITGVVLLSLRWLGAWTYLHRLRRAVSLPVPQEWQRALRDLTRRAAISAPVRLSIQRTTQCPRVIGWLRPVILMPAASLTASTGVL
jgi:bla regulator protein BlaR1